MQIYYPGVCGSETWNGCQWAKIKGLTDLHLFWELQRRIHSLPFPSCLGFSCFLAHGLSLSSKPAMTIWVLVISNHSDFCYCHHIHFPDSSTSFFQLSRTLVIIFGSPDRIIFLFKGRLITNLNSTWNHNFSIPYVTEHTQRPWALGHGHL